MSVHALLQETGPVRILCGEDHFAVDECVARFRGVFEAGNFPEMNIERFYGDERGSEALEDAARSMPAFASSARGVNWVYTLKESRARCRRSALDRRPAPTAARP